MPRGDVANREETAVNCLEADGVGGHPSESLETRTPHLDERERPAKGPPMRAQLFMMGRHECHAYIPSEMLEQRCSVMRRTRTGVDSEKVALPPPLRQRKNVSFSQAKISRMYG